MKNIFAHLLLAPGLLALATACSSAPERADRDAYDGIAPNPAAHADTAPSAGPPEVAPGYEISLSGFNDSKLDARFRIGFDGMLKLPYQVDIPTTGMTREALRGRIVAAYAHFYRSPPSITLSVNPLKLWVEVRGLVEKPGRFLVKPDTSLDEVLGQAGGLLRTTPPKYARFVQGRRSRTISLSEYYAGSPDARIPNWVGGDIVFFQSDRGDNTTAGEVDGSYIQMLGEVHTPGEYRFMPGADFYHYLAKAGGPTATSDPNRIEVLRGPGRDRAVTRFALLEPRTVPEIQPGDIIIVMADKPTNLERAVPVISGFVAILNTVLLLVLLH